MAKKSAIAKNKKREAQVTRDKEKRRKLKDIIMNKTLPIEDRFDASIKFSKLRRDGSKSRVRLRCEVTGRPRGNFRRFRLSRIAFRDLASFGQLPGIKKDSW